MATVTGITAEKATEVLGMSVVAGELDGTGQINFIRNNGEVIPGGDFMDVISALVSDAIFEQAWPIGSIHLSTNPANPSTTLGGGVWTSWGSGRVPVGVDGTQAEFNSVEETGGSKTHTLTVDQIPSHTHVQNGHTHSINHDHASSTTGSAGAHSHSIDSSGGGSTGDLGSNPRLKRASPEASPDYTASDAVSTDGTHSHSVNIAAYSGNSGSTTPTNQNTGGGQAHNNLQPYITCYMWKRTG